MEKKEEDPLAKVFDFVVLGTGLQECLFAAAAARAGASVLHLDGFDYYGGETASFTLNQLPEIASQHAFKKAKEEGSDIDAAGGPDLDQQWPLRFHGEIPKIPDEMRSAARRITVDLLPGLTLCRGHLIDALVDSGVASYLEFVLHHASYCVYPSSSPSSSSAPSSNSSSWQVHRLPCSKSDVFEDGSLGLGQKRSLMKFLQFSQDLLASGELEGTEGGKKKGAKIAASGDELLDADGDSFGCTFPAEGDEADADDEEEADATAAAGAGAGAGSGAAAGGEEALRNLNERVLGMGRSLLRPQNKKTALTSLPFDDFRSKPFSQFLASSAVGMPGHLQTVMMHSVALIRGPGSGQGGSAVVDSFSGMCRLTRYLNAMGRYGGSDSGSNGGGSSSTAFVLPRFGHGELPQAFSRACAVFGGTYMLRTKLRTITDTNSDGDGADGASGPGYFELETEGDESIGEKSLKLKGKQVVSTTAYLPRKTYRSLKPSRFTLGAAVAVVSPPLAPEDFCRVTTEEGKESASSSSGSENAAGDNDNRRHLFTFVIPPHTPLLDNPRTVYVLQQGYGNASTPDNSHAVLNAWTEVGTEVGTGEEGCSGEAARERAVAVVEKLLSLLFSSEPTAAGRVLYRQLFSYQGKQASSSLSPFWHVLSGRSLDAARLTSEFDALEAKRVFYTAFARGGNHARKAGEDTKEEEIAQGRLPACLKKHYLDKGKLPRFFGEAVKPEEEEAKEKEEREKEKEKEKVAADAPAKQEEEEVSTTTTAASSDTSEKVAEGGKKTTDEEGKDKGNDKEEEKGQDLDVDDALALLKGGGSDDW